MKRILILLLGLFSVAYGQFSPTSAKSAFKWGVSIGTRDSTAYAANDSLVVVINRQGRMMYRSTDGYWKLLANAASSDYVPYVGAVSNVFLGSNRIKADAFDLGIPSSSTDSIGRMRWNADDLTMNIGLTSSVVLQSGQEMLILVKNQTGVTIPNGTVVRQSGVVGASGRLKVEPFLANGTHNSNQVLGLTTEDIPNGGDGFVAYFGKVRGLNTAAYPDSTILYASPTVAGGLTSVVPEAPNNIVKIGTVVKSAASNGIIFARVVAGSNINQDEGVQLTNPLNNSLLVYDSLTTLWKDKTLVEIGAVRVQDTAAMLAPYFRDSDTTGLLNNVVRTFGTQTVGGNKTFSNDIIVNSINVGRGGGNVLTNTVLGVTAGISTTSGTENVFIGYESGKANTSGYSNVFLGRSSGVLNTTGFSNVFSGNNAGGSNTTGAANTSIGNQAGFSNVSSNFNTNLGTSAGFSNTAADNTFIGYASGFRIETGAQNTFLGSNSGTYINSGQDNRLSSNSVLLGYDTRQSANGNTNEIVIGHSARGNGSNTVTIGNSSITNNYFSGNIRGGAFIKSGGTSSQFLKADGSVDGTSYATAASISGTTNYIPKFTSSSAIGNSGLITNSADNLGIGVTPNPNWFTGSKVNQFGNVAAIWSNGSNNSAFSHNALFSDASTTYLITAAASYYRQIGGIHDWFTAPSGTAGTSITFSNPMSLSSTQLGLTVPISGTSLSMSGAITGTGTLNLNNPASGATLFNLGNNAASLSALVFQESGNRAFVQYLSPTFGTAARQNSLELGTISAGSFIAFRPLDVEAMRITSSGNVGIGNWSTNVPQDKLHVNGAIQIGFVNSLNSAMRLFWNGASSYGAIQTASSSALALNPSGNDVLIGTTTTDGTNKLIVNGNLKASQGTFTNNSVIVRNGSNTVTSGGYYALYNAATTDGMLMQLNASNNIDFWGLTGTFTSSPVITFTRAGAATFSSSVTATGFIVSSSKTLKDVYYRNKQSDGIDFVGYTWKKNLNLDNKKHLGFIAEEVEKVMPDAVSANEKGTKAVNYTEVLIYKLEKLTDRISELENEMKKLKKKRK